MASGQPFQLHRIPVDQAVFFAPGPALELAFTFDGGQAIRMKFGIDWFHGSKERGCSAARPGLVLGEPAAKIVG
jgi:predicted cupin superfamily sugar epimerase